MAIRFSIPVEIEADNIASFSDITEQIDKLGLNRRALKKAVYLLDDKMRLRLQGKNIPKSTKAFIAGQGQCLFQY